MSQRNRQADLLADIFTVLPPTAARPRREMPSGTRPAAVASKPMPTAELGIPSAPPENPWKHYVFRGFVYRSAITH